MTHGNVKKEKKIQRKIIYTVSECLILSEEVRVFFFSGQTDWQYVVLNLSFSIIKQRDLL